MKRKLLKRFKQFLTILGTSFSSSQLHLFQMVVNYMKLGNWMSKNKFKIEKRVYTRQEVFGAVAEKVSSKKVLYLEFGVFKGASMRYWSRHLKNPETILIGFDSFEGLPEDFDVDGPYVKGTFDVGGAIPKIDDKRVSFVKGWFENTLPSFQLPAHDVLVINLDADLYSATDLVLSLLSKHIKVGTFIYFDDMSRPDHEPAAFKKFMLATKYQFKLVSVDYSLNTAFFERIA